MVNCLYPNDICIAGIKIYCYNGYNTLTNTVTYTTDVKNITFKLVSNDKELRSALEVRRQVFIQEQGITEDEEFDGYDRESLQMVVKDGKMVIGTARVRFMAPNQAKIERMAVLGSFRRKRIGSGIISFLKSELESKQIEHVFLHAQCTARPFYKACGFKETGPTFMEAGIRHVKMQLEF